MATGVDPSVRRHASRSATRKGFRSVASPGDWVPASGEASEIAHAAIFIVENDFFTGRCIDVDGGLRL